MHTLYGSLALQPDIAGGGSPGLRLASGSGKGPRSGRPAAGSDGGPALIRGDSELKAGGVFRLLSATQREVAGRGPEGLVLSSERECVSVCVCVRERESE